jgi:hypothetical protein
MSIPFADRTGKKCPFGLGAPLSVRRGLRKSAGVTAAGRDGAGRWFAAYAAPTVAWQFAPDDFCYFAADERFHEMLFPEATQTRVWQCP